MAVIQISRIQVRRGQKNQGSGIPQLASGELGWAMDSQELFVGNGSVAEGAPQVGNTKILTEHDNLFDLADTYTYKTGSTVQTGTNPNAPIRRTLQERLDDIVSLAAFGGTGDGSDQTATIQRAIDQLFLNEATKGEEQSRVTLVIEPGTYALSDSLKVPPYATIIGAGSDKTVFTQTGTTPIFETVNSESTPGNYSDDSESTTLNQAQRITIKGITLDTVGSEPAIVLQSCKDSVFEDLKIKGYWETSDGVNTANGGIQMNSLSTIVTCARNKFKNITFQYLDTGITSDYDVTDNIIETCVFENLGMGIAFGSNSVLGSQGQATGPVNNTITKCEFREIDQQGLLVDNGTRNSSIDNRYYGVGNIRGTEANATYSVIKFVEPNNNSVNDMFSRTEELSYGQEFIETARYINEIEGPVNTSLGGFHQVVLGQRTEFITLFRLPGNETRSFKVDYNYKSLEFNAMRSGTLEIILNKDLDTLHYVDEYEYFGDITYRDSLSFELEHVDVGSTGSYNTIFVKVKNLAFGDDATFSYNINLQSY